MAIFSMEANMEVVFKNCNSIDEARICIEKNKLNIKLGINGLGKSTIAKALALRTDEDSDLSSLIPFKYRGIDPLPENTPTIAGADEIKSVLVFDEAYIQQFVFQKDELLKNSFEIFIKSTKFDKQMEEIEKNISDIRKTFEADESIRLVIADLKELDTCFGKSTKSQAYGGASPIGKALAKGNKMARIPEKLSSYSDYLQSENNVGWIDWQIGGNEFVEISSGCPYCTAPTEGKREVIKSVGAEFDKNEIKHLNSIRNVLRRLSKYFSDASNKEFEKLLSSPDGISGSGQVFLKSIKAQIELLLNGLSNLQTIGFFSLKDEAKVIETIKSLHIKMDHIHGLNSAETCMIVDKINVALESVISKVELLQRGLDAQKKNIESTIKAHKDGINGFLRCAGYKYSIDIESDLETESYKLRLKHVDSTEVISGGRSHLSFGERNAFSMVLFMYECLRRKPDLIILDDPVSSFDKNKKYALLETLFRRESELRGKTVLMLTHDLEPVIDMVYIRKGIFGSGTHAVFLKSENGKVSEVPITSDDVLSFTKVCEEIFKSSEDEVIKLVHLRRLSELLHEREAVYNLLSNLFHKRAKPVFKNPEREMSAEEITEASAWVRGKVPGFEYNKVLLRLKDTSDMKRLFQGTKSNQAKLQVFRIIATDIPEGEASGIGKFPNSIVEKFINETYHIENDYLMQLDPMKFETVPQFIVEECSAVLFGAPSS
jgi:ABC-type Mn2+/Zn2+ transport system ATPase subunit